MQAKFFRKFNLTIIPRKSKSSLGKFQATGSVNNLKKKAVNPRSGWKLSARGNDNVDAVRDSVGRSPKKSLGKRSQKLGLSHVLLQRILKKDLQL